MTKRPVETPKLQDDQTEQLLKLEDCFYCESAEGVLRIFENFDSEFGDRGVLLVARTIMSALAGFCSLATDELPDNDRELLKWRGANVAKSGVAVA